MLLFLRPFSVLRVSGKTEKKSNILKEPKYEGWLRSCRDIPQLYIVKLLCIAHTSGTVYYVVISGKYLREWYCWALRVPEVTSIPL